MENSAKRRFRIIRRIFWAGVLALACLVTGSLFWNIEREISLTRRFAAIEAEASFHKDLVYRRWAAMHGGLYVPITDDTPPNPHLSHVPDRDIALPSGKRLTLVNPAYMTRQVHELSNSQYGVRGHITSLRPLRPGNIPDSWERRALENFETDPSMQTAVVEMNGALYLRMMNPMRTEKSCLKCHAVQGYRVGDVRGGISVSVPLSPYDEVARAGVQRLILSHLLLLAVLGAASAAAYRKIYRDSAAQATAEQAIAESEERYRRLAEAGFEAVIVSKEGRITDVSRQIAAIFGHSPETFIAQGDWTAFLVPEDRALAVRNAAANVSEPYELRGSRADGTTVHLEVRHEQLTVAGEPHQMTVLHDISGIKRMESRLRQAEKMQAIGQLAGGIAHDFNNILGALIGFAEMAGDDAPRGSAQAHHIEQVLKAADRARDLVSRILTYSRQGGQNMQVTSLSAVIDEVLTLCRAAVPSSVKIEAEMDKDVPPISADPTQIHEVLLNLISNGVFAMAEKGVLRVGLRQIRAEAPIEGRIATVPEGAYAVIDVADTGEGMDDALLRRIFDPFFTTKPVGKGTGMGLSVVQGVMSAHGGAVTVASEPGKGTVFSLYFPLRKEAAAVVSDAPDPGLFTGNERILFVDDEAMMAKMAAGVLARLGYRVTTRTDPLEALDLIRESPDMFDMLITDQTMPGMTGIELCRAVAAVRPDLPAILCTGFSNAVGPEEALSLGVRFCTKPISRRQLSAVIREMLDSPPSGAA